MIKHHVEEFAQRFGGNVFKAVTFQKPRAPEVSESAVR
jgi:hypothetical protein